MFDYKLNPESDANNVFDIQESQSGCCGTAKDACAYKVTVTFPVASFIAKDTDGNDVTMTFAAPATNAEELRDAINMWVKMAPTDGGLGGADFSDGIVGMNITDNGATADLSFVGAIEFVSIDDNGGTQNFVANCTKYRSCSVQLVANYGTNLDITYNGNTETVAVPVAGDVATLQTNLDTAVGNLAIPEGVGVASEDTLGGFYLVKITGEITANEITSGTITSTDCGCEVQYKV